MTTIRGVTIGITVRTDRAQKAFDKLSDTIVGFDRRMKNIRLEGVIKGNPFSNTNKYIKETGKELNSLFNSWKEAIDKVPEKPVVGQFAKDARTQVRNLWKEFEPLNEKLDEAKEKFQNFKAGPGSFNIAQMLGLADKSGRPLGGAAFKGRLGKIFSSEDGKKEFSDTLKIFSNFGKKAGKIAEDFDQKVAKKLKNITSKDFNKFLTNMTDALNKEGGKLKKAFDVISLEYRQFGKKIASTSDFIKKVASIQKALRFSAERQARLKGQTLDKEGVPKQQKPREQVIENVVLKERAKVVRDIRLENAKAYDAVKQGVDVQKNLKTLETNINKLKQEGIRLSEKELLAEKDIAKQNSLQYQLKRQAKALGLSLDKSGVVVAQETKERIIQNTVLQKRAKLVRDIRLENVEAYDAIKQGIEVEKNIKTLETNINKLKKEGIILSDKEIEAQKKIAKYNAEQFESRRRAKLQGVTVDASGVAVAQAPREQTIQNASLKEQAKLITNIKLENIKALDAIKQGVQVEKNREILSANINKLKEIGYGLSKKEILAEKEIEKSLTVQSRSERLGFERDLKNAKNLGIVLKDRKKRLQELEIAEAKLNTERKAGVNISEYRNNMAKIYLERQKLGVKLTKQQSKELKRYQKETKRATNAQAALFSKKWIKVRLRWFLELRLLWGAYRSLANGIRDTINFEVQLSRALRTASSTTKNTIQLTNAYIEALQAAVKLHGAEWDAPAEALYQLGSAGLSAEEALAGLNSTMSLIIGTEGDVRETTKAVAGIYNNFKDTLTEINSAEEKLVYINDLVAAAWKRHQVEISELTDGYRRSSAVARLVGVSLKDLTAILSVANDHMIKGGVAGRALTSVWSRLSKDVRKFKDVFQVNIDTSQPIQFLDIMRQLSERFREGALTVDQLGDMFERLGLRGSPVFATLLKNWDDVIKAQWEFNDVTGEAVELEKTRLDNLDGQWKKFLGTLRSYLANAKGFLEFLGDAVERFTQRLDYLLSGTEIQLDRQLKTLIKLINERRSRIQELEKLSKVPFYVDLDQLKKDLKALEEQFDRVLEQRRKLSGKGTLPIDFVREDRKRAQRRALTGEFPTPGKSSRRRVSAAQQALLDENLKKEKKRQQEYDYLADKEARRIRKPLKLEEQLQKARNEVAKQRAVLDDEIAKRAINHTNAQAKAVLEAQELYNKLVQEREKLYDQVAKKQIKELKATLAIYEEQEKTEMDIIDLEIKRLKQGGTTKKEAREISELTLARGKHEKNLNRIKEEQNILDGKDVELARQQLDLADRKSKIDTRNRLSDNDRAALQTQLNRLLENYNDEIAKQNKETEIAKLEHSVRGNILVLQKKALETQKEYLQDRLKLLETYNYSLEVQKQIAAVRREMLENDTDILKTQEEISRRSSIIYDWIQRLRDGSKEWHDVITDVLTSFTTGFAEGLGSLSYDFLSGFQDQQQEVEDLKGELTELGKEYDEAVSEGDIERTKEINAQMAELRRQIEDLEDPLEQLKEGFKDFFKSLIDDIGEAITKWIALKIVMGVIDAFTYAGPEVPSFEANLQSPYTGGGVGQYHLATGGVLPRIKSFRSFSSGGLTGRPTLAFLGDNRSGQELVIPSENIESNRVSGYMRDSNQGDTYIINAVTNEDIAQAMAQTQGERVILNTVFKNKDKISRVSNN